MKLLKENGKILKESYSDIGHLSDGDYCAVVVTTRSGSWAAYPGKVVGNKIYTCAIDYNRNWIRKERGVCPIDASIVSDKDKQLIEMNIASKSREADSETWRMFRDR